MTTTTNNGLFGSQEVASEKKTMTARITNAETQTREFDNGPSTTYVIELTPTRPATWKAQKLYLKVNKNPKSHFAAFRKALLGLKEDVADIKELVGREYDWEQVTVRESVSENNRQYAQNISASTSGREYGDFQRWVPVRRATTGQSSTFTPTTQSTPQDTVFRVFMNQKDATEGDIVGALVLENQYTPAKAREYVDQLASQGVLIPTEGNRYALGASALI